MKKRMFALCLVLLALFSACGKKAAPLDPDASWVTKKDGLLVVTLPQDKGTDYHWDVSISDSAPITLSSQETAKDGSIVYTFSATGDGEANVSFSYANPTTLVQVRTVQAACQGSQVVEVTQKDTMDMNMPYTEG